MVEVFINRKTDIQIGRIYNYNNIGRLRKGEPKAQ